MGDIRNVVLVHGAFVDASGWEPVYKLLTQAGYSVGITQNPTVTLDGDVAYVHKVIERMDGPVVLVGHSYAGSVITAAGTHHNVAALVYINAFAPDAGESVAKIIQGPLPPDAPVAPLLPPDDGFLMLDRSKFHAAFCADLPADKAAFMADCQTPWGLEAVGGVIKEPAWKSRPSWYLIGTEDHMVPPFAQRLMAQRAGATVVEHPGSHAIMLSQPQVVADLIQRAARGEKSAAAGQG